jgi:hypothetical protein
MDATIHSQAKNNLEHRHELGQKIKSTTSSNFSKFGKRLAAIKIPNGKFSLEIKI